MISCREVYPFAPSGAAFSASTITFQWGQEGSAALWAWGNYTACAIANGPAVRQAAHPSDLLSNRLSESCMDRLSCIMSCLDRNEYSLAKQTNSMHAHETQQIQHKAAALQIPAVALTDSCKESVRATDKSPATSDSWSCACSDTGL